MIIKRKYTVLLLIFLSLFFHFRLFSQSKSGEEIPTECEAMRALLDNSLIRISQNEDASLIFIFRLGKSEKSRKVISRRMETIKNFFKFRIPAFNRFVLAEGERTAGLGKLEIYIDGKLTYELFAKKNADLGDDCLE